MEYLMIAFCLVVILLLGWIILNLTAKNSALLKYVEDSDKDLYAAINVVSFTHRLVSETYATLLQVDKRGGFSSDDEVGFAFKAIFECIQQSKVALDNLVTIKDGNSGESPKEEEGKK